MEIVNIDAQTFERMLSKFESFTERMEQLYRLHGTRDMGEWLDNQDAVSYTHLTLPTKRIV